MNRVHNRLVAMVDLYFFSGNRSVKLLDLHQVVTVLNQNVTESIFTYSRLVTFQNIVISKGSVTTITARVTVTY